MRALLSFTIPHRRYAAAVVTIPRRRYAAAVVTIPRRRYAAAVVCAVVVASGCAENRQYFRPTEHVYGHTLQGHGEAIYELVGPFGPFGEAKVWSPGAFREENGTVLHANVDLHNTSGVAIEIDPQQIRLDPVRAGATLLRDIPPIETQRLSVAPGAFGRVHLQFRLPPEFRPGHVVSFGLRWQVKNGPQNYAQVTPFTEAQPRRYGYYGAPVYGYGYGTFCSAYDPFCYPRGYYGFGVGYGIGGYGGYGGGVILSPGGREGARPRETIRTR